MIPRSRQSFSMSVSSFLFFLCSWVTWEARDSIKSFWTSILRRRPLMYSLVSTQSMGRGGFSVEKVAGLIVFPSVLSMQFGCTWRIGNDSGCDLLLGSAASGVGIWSSEPPPVELADDLGQLVYVEVPAFATGRFNPDHARSKARGEDIAAQVDFKALAAILEPLVVGHLGLAGIFDGHEGVLLAFFPDVLGVLFANDFLFCFGQLGPPFCEGHLSVPCDSIVSLATCSSSPQAFQSALVKTLLLCSRRSFRALSSLFSCSSSSIMGLSLIPLLLDGHQPVQFRDHKGFEMLGLHIRLLADHGQQDH